MKTTNRIATLLLLAAFLITLSACGNNASSTNNGSDINSDSQYYNSEAIENRNVDEVKESPKAVPDTPKPMPATPVPVPTKSPGADVYDAFLKATALQKKDLIKDNGRLSASGIRRQRKK